MPKPIACGLLMYRWNDKRLEFFLVHPGGPFFKNKRTGVWSIPKGLPEGDEDKLVTAIREFTEETGIIPTAPFVELTPVQQKGGKIVYAWAFEGKWNPADGIMSNTFKLEWPPSSGKFQSFPEQDEAAWMDFEKAKIAINPGQIALLEQALLLLSAP
jgi:predicted NUDIX family NTP pyrophosphohydrolase